MDEYDLIIIGGGPAGYSAGLYASRFKLKTLILTAEKGGKIKLTHIIENYPGAGSVKGIELMDRMESQVLEFGCKIEEGRVKRLEKDGENFVVKTEDKSFKSKTVIIATGLERRKLDIPGEEDFQNKGVSFCASCDGALFKNKIVGVVGGNDSAAKEALLLSEYAQKVYIIYRKEKIRAEPIIIDAVEAKVKEGKIEIINNANVVEVKGEKRMSHVVLDREFNGGKNLELSGLFIEIGGVPGSVIARDIGVNLDEKEYILIDCESKTNVPGVFAAGDVTSIPWKQAITAAAQGAYAAYSAYNYLSVKK